MLNTHLILSQVSRKRSKVIRSVSRILWKCISLSSTKQITTGVLTVYQQTGEQGGMESRRITEYGIKGNKY